MGLGLGSEGVRVGAIGLQEANREGKRVGVDMRVCVGVCVRVGSKTGTGTVVGVGVCDMRTVAVTVAIISMGMVRLMVTFTVAVTVRCTVMAFTRNDRHAEGAVALCTEALGHPQVKSCRVWRRLGVSERAVRAAGLVFLVSHQVCRS